MSDNRIFTFKDTGNPKDITNAPLAQMSEALSKSGVAPDENWFRGKSGFFADLGNLLNEPKSFWDRLKGFLLNVMPAATLGASAGLVAGPVGAIGGFIAGALAGALFQPITAVVNFVGSRGEQIRSFVVDLAISTGLLASTFVSVKNSMASALSAILNQADFLYEFNFDIPDSQIWQQIKSLIDGLYGQAGDFLGSSFARILLTGSLEPPKVEIDIRGLSLAYSEFAEDRREDLLSGVSSFSHTCLITSQRVAFLFAFLRGRNIFKQFILDRPSIKKSHPDVWKFAQDWGDEEDPNTPENEVKDWRVSTWVENKFEQIKSTYGQQIGSFVEQFFESFGEEVRDILDDYIVYKFV